jgi:calcineurin-like phosphoesterase family protein
MGRLGRRAPLLAVMLLASVGLACSPSEPRSSPPAAAVWLQLGPDGTRLARAITTASTCPAARVDDAALTLTERAAPGPAYGVRTCEAVVAPQVRRVTVAGQEIPNPAGPPQRIAVLGDTGCRLKKVDGFQACNDPQQWPFARIAQSVARYQPDLIIDVGDYLYREEACPTGNTGCAGSPWGQNWDTWNADFFAPAAPALTAAPWVFVRGDHESCARAGDGWFRFLEPRPMTACTDMTAPYTIPVGSLRLLMMDTVNANDTTPEPTAVQTYAEQFRALGSDAGENAWLLSHRPLWGLVPDPSGAMKLSVVNATLEQAARDTLPAGVQLVLTGHVHLAEVLDFSGARPPQMIAGIGGTLLLPEIGENVVGMTVDDATLTAATLTAEHGFITLEPQQDGWTATIRNTDGAPQPTAQCHLEHQQATCA